MMVTVSAINRPQYPQLTAGKKEEEIKGLLHIETSEQSSPALLSHLQRD